VIPRGSAGQHHHQNHQHYQIRQKNQVKRQFSEENVFRKTATAAKTENKNKQETKYKRKYKTFGTRAADKRKREETRNKVHHCSSRKTRAAVQKQSRQLKVKCSPQF
jgi:hypothetical protein